MSMCVRAGMCVCVYMHVFICVYMCVHVCACVYMCVHVCTCVCLCVRITVNERTVYFDLLSPFFSLCKYGIMIISPGFGIGGGKIKLLVLGINFTDTLHVHVQCTKIMNLPKV